MEGLFAEYFLKICNVVITSEILFIVKMSRTLIFKTKVLRIHISSDSEGITPIRHCSHEPEYIIHF